MSRLRNVTRFEVPRSALEEAHAFLAHVGQRGDEGMALWAGVIRGTVCRVTATYIPEQRAIRTEHGVCVVVDAPELHRLNLWLYQAGLRVAGQLHTHPGEAYHSDLDDEMPIATTAGALSIVIPNFARAPFGLELCAVYRLVAGPGWVNVPPAEASRLIKVFG